MMDKHKIAGLINSLLVWQGHAAWALDREDNKQLQLAMRTFDGHADELIAMGIPVIKYRKEAA